MHAELIIFQKSAESSPCTTDFAILWITDEDFHTFFFSFRIEETDDSSKTDPDNNLSRAVTANTLFPPGIEE